MANSFFISNPPLTPFLLRNKGRIHRFGQSNIGGFVSLQGRRNIMLILKTPVQASRDRDESEFFDRIRNPVSDPALNLMALSVGMDLVNGMNWSSKRNKIIIMVKWLSSLSHVPELKDMAEFCNEAIEIRENKIKEILKREDEMSKSPIDRRARENLETELAALDCNIFEVFSRYQFECTPEKIDDMLLAMMLREIIDTTLYSLMKEVGETLCTMATHLLRTDQSCLWKKELVEGLAFFGGRLMYTAECAITIPIFADFSAERQKFVDSLNFQCHPQLGAYDLLYKVISTMGEFDSLLLQCEDEIESYLQDGFLKLSQDNGDAIMSDNIIEWKNSRSFIMLTEKKFKELVKDMRRNGRSLDYQKTSQNFIYTLASWIFGCNTAIKGIKRLIF